MTQEFTSTGYFIVSFLFGFVLLFKFYNIPELSVLEKPKVTGKYILYPLFAVAFIILNETTIHIIKTIDPGPISNILSTIGWLTKRFISGHDPYNIQSYLAVGENNVPAYLTMHWLPYTIPEFFHFDYRTMSFAIWCIGAFTVMFQSMRHNKFWISFSVLILLSVLYWLIAQQYPRIIGVTVEIMVAAYYMFLIMGLNHRSIILTGLTISICLLSRYYVAMWLPLWAFVLFVSDCKKQLFKTILVIIFFVSILFIIPFFIRDHAAIYATFVGYKNLSINEWHNLNGNSLPWHLYYGVGFAYLFYEKYLHTDLQTGFNLLQHILFIATFLIIFLMGLLFWFIRKRINNKIFLMASFKIYLSIFLAFIMAPYLYLYITDIFISIVILSEQSRYNIGVKSKVKG